MIIKRTYKFKLKPTKEQESQFLQWLGVCRLVYNIALDINKESYRKIRKNVSKNDMQKQLTDIRADYDWVEGVYVHTLQDVTERLYKAYDNFFRRCKERKKGKKIKAGFPKFAKKGKYKSFSFKSGVKLLPNTNTVKLPKLGKVKFRKSREVIGDIKYTTIVHEADGWYVCFSVEQDYTPMPKTNKITGGDVGLQPFLTLDTGEEIVAPKPLIKYQKELRIAQRSMSRKKKFSKNWYKALYEVQKIYLKIKNIREDFLQKLSTRLISENQVIGLEKLNISGLMKNYKLAKHIGDAGWGNFFRMMKYKGEWNDRFIYQVDTFYPSTKKCSNPECDYVCPSLALSVKEWDCPSCGVHHLRNVNAGINLKTEAGYAFAALESVNSGDNIAPLLASKDVQQVRYAKESPIF